jgi:hypothetical protein
MKRLTATLREQHAEAAKLDAATCLRRVFSRQDVANLPACRNFGEGR